MHDHTYTFDFELIDGSFPETGEQIWSDEQLPDISDDQASESSVDDSVECGSDVRGDQTLSKPAKR